ncbi:non-ribosomal peptide synthetase [Sphingomonas sp. 37zxx]|uniref:non-ribosomal peptide synthetase n=1 Tax=Sphingomonas sp. 37zxx TaxID=1550073 RepID=UPI00068F7F40|nr:non-ribosomal peptide synthetase [Sphingomonas sp. 37zxx]
MAMVADRLYVDEERASFAQERLWLLQQLDPSDSGYNLAVPISLPAGTNAATLAAAMADMVERHDSLRTLFEDRDGVPWQCVPAPYAPDVTTHDFAGLSPEARDASLADLIAGETAITFDLAAAPPLRCHHVSLGDAGALALIMLHHVNADGWSMHLFARDLTEFCLAHLADRAPELPPLEYQYVHFSAWQREQIERGAYAEQLEYWVRTLADAPPVLDLPFDRQRTPQPDPAGGTWVVHFPNALRDALNQIARTENATLYMVLMAGYQALLSRLGGQGDIIVATPVGSRPRIEFDDIFGCFLNNVLVRGKPLRTQTFREFVKATRTAVLDAFAHQEIPLEVVIEAVKPPRSRTHNPLFQTMLVLQNAPGTPGATVVEDQPDDGAGPALNAKFELSVALWENASGISAAFEYRRDLFDEATVAALANAYRALLTDAAARPDTQLGELAMLDTAAQRRMLHEWNAVPLDYPDTATIHGLFEAQVERDPDAVAVIFEDLTLTYGALNHAANLIAHRLIALGAGPETCVPVVCEQSIEMIVALLGVLKAGAAYVPIDPTLPIKRIEYLIESVAPKAVLTLSRHAGLISDPGVPLIPIDDAHTATGEDPGNPGAAVSARNLAYVIFTSGTTGPPKGVEVEHRSAIHHLWGMREQYAVTSADRFLQKHPFNFDVSVWEFFLPLATGGSTVMVRPDGQRDLDYMIDRIITEGVTIVCFLPSALQVLLDHPRIGLLDSSVRWMLCGAEAMARDVPLRFFERLGARLHNLYGPTETTVHNSWYECLPGEQPAVIPIGRPMPGVRLYVLDPALQPVPVGVPGEIHIGGASVARGYRNSPEITAARFVADPFTDGPDARMYRTGDIGRFHPDGNIEFIGRRDRQFKIRGFRIELGEIGHVLRLHPEVRDALVVVREDTPGEQRIVAYVVARTAALDEAAMLDHAAQHLPRHMIPAAVMMLAALPLAANDKIDFQLLPAPARHSRDASRRPKGPTETGLAAIWSLLLGADVEGVDDDFFDLGGHSLLAARLVAQVRARLGRLLPIRAVFETPRLGAMAQAIAQAPVAADDLSAVLRRPRRS